MTAHVLGISAFYHDSAAALISGGRIVAAAQQERFSRVKHDPSFPTDAVRYCLTSQGLGLGDLESVVFYESPPLKFTRLLSTYIGFAPRGVASFRRAMSSWLPRKLFLRQEIARELSQLTDVSGECRLPRIVYGHHHRSHAASAFFPSPFERAAVLCMDGVGEWDTTSVWLGEGHRLTPLWSIHFPHSLGLLYSAFTQYAGFKVNSGEYKLMGLAPYGRPEYVDLILDHLIDLRPDGTFRLDMSFFDYPTGFRMVSRRFEQLFGGPCREPEGVLTQRHMDIARSIQAVTEKVVARLAATVHRETGTDYLCLAGGIALNCVANGVLLRQGLFRDIWVQPAAGDAGSAAGAALSHWHERLGNPRKSLAQFESDQMSGSFLGPQYTTEDAQRYFDGIGARYEVLSEDLISDRVARLIADGNVVGWMSGRMEFGPRALGARSILGDPRNPQMQSIMNLKIKFRESFRPFAPAILAESVSDYFEMDRQSPYMLFVAPVRSEIRTPEAEGHLFGIDRLNLSRSLIPAVTHVDYTARVQTVVAETNPRFHALLSRFRDLTGCPVLINTSFNVRGEPIVCTPRDAYICFMRTGIDYLIVENCLLSKKDQPRLDDVASTKHVNTPD
jgi:carbamoyltransferase